MSWPTVRFEELYAEPSRNGVYKPKQFHGSGVRIVNMGELFAYDIIADQEMKRLAMTDTEMTRSGLADGDLLFGRRSLIESGAGKCSLVEGISEPTTFESSIIRVRVDEDRLRPRFIYYWLKSHLGRGTIRAIVTGTNIKGIRGSVLKDVLILYPPIEAQDIIVENLRAYDDLIENNRRRIQLLEQAARLLYKEWFVHLRFPGHEHVKIKDGVPDGWEKEMVTSHLEFVRGVEPGSKNYMAATDEERVPFLRVGDFGSRSSNIYIDATLAKGKMLEPEDMAITMDGTPGLVSFGMKGAFSSGIRKVIPKEQCGIGWSFIYELLQSDAIQSTVERFAKGTTILHASSSLNHMVFLKPTETLLDLFEDTTAPVLRQILLLNDQNQQLSQARNLLLPRLMNGEVAV